MSCESGSTAGPSAGRLPQFNSIDFASDGNAGLAEGVGDLRFAEARSIVFEGQHFFGVVDAEAAEAVSVGELAEAAELRIRQGRLQFVGDFHEGHGESIAG